MVFVFTFLFFDLKILIEFLSFPHPSSPSSFHPFFSSFLPSEFSVNDFVSLDHWNWRREGGKLPNSVQRRRKRERERERDRSIGRKKEEASQLKTMVAICGLQSLIQQSRRCNKREREREKMITPLFLNNQDSFEVNSAHDSTLFIVLHREQFTLIHL